jgi:hypothetical protein
MDRSEESQQIGVAISRNDSRIARRRKAAAMKGLQSRLEELERRLGGGGDWDITCRMPDGTEHVIALRGKTGWDDLFEKCRTDRHCPEAETFRQAAQVIGPGDSLLGELIAAMVCSPWDGDPARESEPAMPLPAQEPQ